MCGIRDIHDESKFEHEANALNQYHSCLIKQFQENKYCHDDKQNFSECENGGIKLSARNQIDKQESDRTKSDLHKFGNKQRNKIIKDNFIHQKNDKSSKQDQNEKSLKIIRSETDFSLQNLATSVGRKKSNEISLRCKRPN